MKDCDTLEGCRYDTRPINARKIHKCIALKETRLLKGCERPECEWCGQGAFFCSDELCKELKERGLAT
jgi:hypothetical protein